MAVTRSILVLGAGGALGRSLLQVADTHPDLRCVGASRAEADVTNRNAVDNAIRKYSAQIVINCAAMTDVDGCERDPMLASAVNAEGARTVAEACAHANVLLVHASTDFVFDGNTDRPYREGDAPHPLGVYGATKLEGEHAIERVRGKSLIVRTAWTFGPGRANFVTKVLDRARAEGKLDMIRTQTGSPTWTNDLAVGILALIFSGAHGLYHVVNSGTATRVELAEAVLELSGLTGVTVNPVDGAPSAWIAKRPSWSVLDASQFTAKTGLTLVPWREALAAYLKGLPA
ncbi:MAG: dTDP-4-dehydrorhamnose reductase [Candidatus Coatesbacteria bacterium]